MKVYPSLWLFFLLAFGLLVAHLSALHYKLYFFVPWFDLLMHTWGGFLVIFGFMMLGSIGSRRLQLPPVLMWVGLGMVMLAWEVFEYVYGIAGTHPSYVIDTTTDTIVGILGGGLAFLFTRRS
jgi:hypothetical protein